MPLSPEQKARLDYLRAKHGSPAAPPAHQEDSGPQYSPLESAYEGFYKGPTADGGKEDLVPSIRAGIDVGANSLQGLLGKVGVGPGAVDEDLRKRGFNVTGPKEQSFAELKKEYENRRDAAAQQNPTADAVGQGAAVLATSAIPSGAIAKGMKAAPYIGKGLQSLSRGGVLARAGAGAIEGAGQSVGTDLARTGDVNPLSALFGGAGGAVAKAAAPAARMAEGASMLRNPADTAAKAEEEISRARGAFQGKVMAPLETELQERAGRVAGKGYESTQEMGGLDMLKAKRAAEQGAYGQGGIPKSSAEIQKGIDEANHYRSELGRLDPEIPQVLNSERQGINIQKPFRKAQGKGGALSTLESVGSNPDTAAAAQALDRASGDTNLLGIGKALTAGRSYTLNPLHPGKALMSAGSEAARQAQDPRIRQLLLALAQNKTDKE